MTLCPNQTQPKANVHRATPIRRISRGVDDRGDQQVYPYSFRRNRVDQWTSCLHLCLFSTYVYMEKQGWTHFSTRSFTSRSSTRLHVCTNLFPSVIAFMYEEGHTRDLCFASMGLPPHLNATTRSTCKFLWDSDALAVIHLRHPASEGGLAVYPYSFLRMMFQQCTFWFVMICLGQNYMENKVGTL